MQKIMNTEKQEQQQQQQQYVPPPASSPLPERLTEALSNQLTQSEKMNTKERCKLCLGKMIGEQQPLDSCKYAITLSRH
jgi:hypothetical protein